MRTKPHDVFLSYSSKDRGAAEAICDALERNGVRVWMAPRDILPGLGWAESIISAINGARLMVLVFSSNANASPQIEREIERAIHKGILVVPFRLEDVQPTAALEYFISSPHWLDAFTPPLEKHLESLADAVKRLLGSDRARAKKHDKQSDPVRSSLSLGATPARASVSHNAGFREQEKSLRPGGSNELYGAKTNEEVAATTDSQQAKNVTLEAGVNAQQADAITDSHVVLPGKTPLEPIVQSGERRQITVLFASIVDFTAISERLGEEGTYTLVQPISELIAGIVRELSGSAKDFAGEGIMALFGVPNALEDAPLRACRAGLLICEQIAAAVPAIEAKHGVRLQVRIGINSGLAIVTQIAGETANIAALGDTVNMAAQLQALAEPGTVLLSEAANRLVQGLVETTSGGTRVIKGKAELQKVYRLDSVRRGATRFEAATGRGLSAYVGRERELQILERNLAEARSQLQVIDIVAEPGMGKSRLLYEFRHRIAKEQAFILSGSCSPDGRQTPFLPFIEVVRGSFQISAGEAENEMSRKLEVGLNVLGLHSLQNLGLLHNLLGLKPPEGALTGLDGVLIGLRTRDLLQHFLEARCRLSPVVLLIEDLHWIDSASEEVLSKIIGGGSNLRLLLLHTRRPEYRPAWLGGPNVTSLDLEPLPAGDIKRMIQTRLGVEALPEALARMVIEKAEGNALFAEEIASFLTERGALRVTGGNAEFDANLMAAALPASVQSLLDARVDRLELQDRALLQAAAVIGRRFDPQLLAVVVDDGGKIDARLAAMQALDLVYPEGKSGDYAFKHALVRDALYQSLLTGPRAALHLRTAEELERRRGNRLAEVAETLADHYRQTDRADKAFTYLAMAGAKSVRVDSFEAAGNHFAAAIALLDEKPDCASDSQVADLLADYTLCLNLILRLKWTTETVERFKPRLECLGNNATNILIQHHYILALIWSARYREAEEAATKLSELAAKLHDARSKAYALVCAIHVSTHVSPYSLEAFEALGSEAIAAASSIDDPYLRNVTRAVVGWEEFHRGRIVRAHQVAAELMAAGRSINDPRSIGDGMRLHSWVALTSDDYVAGLNFAETSISISRTPFNQQSAESARHVALVLLRRPEAFEMLRDRMGLCASNGWQQHMAGLDGIWAVALVVHGEIGAGIRWMEQAILRREDEGYRAAADWFRMFLCEIYLEIISGNERPSPRILAKNILTLAAVMFTAQKRICALVERVRQSTQFDPNGHHIGRCEMILGMLYKTKKRRELAIQHLTEANRIVSQFGATPLLARIDAALADLSTGEA